MPGTSFNSVEQRLHHDRSSAQIVVHQKFVYELVRLASSKISRKFNGKVEPEDVVQSVFKSFFARHKDGRVYPQNWNEMWSLLATMTVRKCYRSTEKYLSNKRSVSREISLNVNSHHSFGVEDRLPNAMEVMIFEETLASLLEPMTDLQKQIIALKLSGFTKSEISKKVGRTERTVYRAFNVIRRQLQKIYTEFET